MTTHKEGNEYDVIFAGGGTSACVAAGRLAAADPSLSILLVEGGKNNLNDPTVVNPAIYLSHLAPNSQSAIFYKAEAEEALNGREAIVPCGGILGGGSSINFMMYTRAQGRDYDEWKMDGWDHKSLLPYLKKLETYHIDDPSIDKSLHGYDGPINISFGTHGPKGPQDDFIAAAESLGEREIVDLQDFTSCGGFSRWARYVCPEGTRQDAAHRYIHPLMADGSHKNLHLLLESKVSRVLFEGRRAVGVESVTGQSAASTVRAKKMVVVSAGALGTPQILERSGVGSAELLKKLDIEVISDLPGVGENYQDHHLIIYPYKTTLKPDETIDGLLSGRLDFVGAMKERNPILGWNAIDICSKVRPNEEEIKGLGPDFREAWDRDFRENTDRPLMLMGVVSSFLGDHSLLPVSDPPVQYASVGAYTAYPYSRGRIHISSRDASHPASFRTGFLSHPADLAAHVWAYKRHRELYRRTNAYAGELEMGHPKFREGSKAAIKAEDKEKKTETETETVESGGIITGEQGMGSGEVLEGQQQTTQPATTNGANGVNGHGHTNGVASETVPGTAPSGKKAKSPGQANGGLRFKSVQDRQAVQNLEYDDEDDRAIEDFVRANVNTTWHSCGTCKMAPREKGGVVDGRLNVYGVEGLKCVDLSIMPENVAANTNNTALMIGEKAAALIGEELGIKV